MANEVKVPGGRGGNRHPLSVRGFILGHLEQVRENYPAAMHRAYKAELERLAKERGRSRPYHPPTYHSFEVKVSGLVREGVIETSGREEVSDSERVKGQERKPVRRFYRLKK